MSIKKNLIIINDIDSYSKDIKLNEVGIFPFDYECFPCNRKLERFSDGTLVCINVNCREYAIKYKLES